MRRIYIFLLSLCLCLSPLTAWADEEPITISSPADIMDYVETLHNENSGMATSEANSILQDQQGYIWIGSYGGLSRYSGRRFENISQTRPGAPTGGIRILFEDSAGRLWIGTNDTGLYYYENDVFYTIDESPDLPSDYLRSLSVRSLAEDRNGNIFIGTTNGLFVVNHELKISRWGNGNIQDTTIADLICDSHGHIWGITSSNSLFILAPEEDTPFYTKTYSDLTLSSALYESDDGTFYIGTEGSQVIALRTNGDVMQESTITHSLLSTKSRSTINDIYKDSQGKLWVCTDKGLGYFDQNHVFYEVHSPSSDTIITQMFEDYEGNLWFASSRRGVLELARSKFKNISSEAGITNQSANATVLYSNSLYIGTDNGLSIMDEHGARVSNELTDMLSGIRIRHLMKDSAGNLWISTYQQYGLVCYRADTGAITVFTEEQGMSHIQIRMTLELSDGSIAAATKGGITLLKDGQVTDVFCSDDGLLNEVILCLAQDSDGTLYAGSDGNGIYIIDLASRSVKNLTTSDGLTSGVILRMTVDSEHGDIWISNGSALNRYHDGQIFSVPSVNTGAGSIFDIKVKGEDIWLVKSSGLIHIQRDDLINGNPVYDELSRKDGLTSSITANSWNYLSKNGMMFLCTGNGVYFIHTGDIYLNTTTPKIYVSQITTDGPVFYGIEDITLPADVKRMTLQLDLLSFGFAEGTLEYWLEGFDEAPMTVGSHSDNYVTYTNLPGGNYTFHLQGFNADGTASEPLSFRIHKELALYERQSINFMIFFAALALLMSVIVVIQTVKKRRSLRRQQEYRALTDQTIQMVSKTIDAKDKYTIGHSHRVAAYAEEIGARYGLNSEQLEQLRYSALLHDIGKIGIPDHILNKAGRLTDEEYGIIKQHPAIGGEILDDFTLAPWIADGARYHHERYDGKGYNEQKSGESIPLYARIIAVADAYDAMNAARVYRPSLTKDVIFQEIQKGSGTQFDPVFAGILMDMIRDHFTAE